MSYSSAIYQQTPYEGNFGQITQIPITGFASIASNTTSTLGVLGFGPGTYLVTFNYSIYNPGQNDIGPINFSFGASGNQIVYKQPILFPGTPSNTNVPYNCTIGGCCTFPVFVSVPYNVALSVNVTYARGVGGPYIDNGIAQFSNFQAIKIC